MWFQGKHNTWLDSGLFSHFSFLARIFRIDFKLWKKCTIHLPQLFHLMKHAIFSCTARQRQFSSKWWTHFAEYKKIELKWLVILFVLLYWLEWDPSTLGGSTARREVGRHKKKKKKRSSLYKNPNNHIILSSKPLLWKKIFLTVIGYKNTALRHWK